MSSQQLKQVPKFNSEQEENVFWQTHDSTEYIDWKKANKVAFVKLKPSTETISLRLPAGLLARIKQEATRLDVPYQSLMKVRLYEAFMKLKSNKL